MTSEQIDRARAVRLEDEISRRGIKLRGRNGALDGPCPVCGGTDRFAVNTKKPAFNCRRCGIKGGDAIALTMALDGCGFGEAVETLTGESFMPNGHAKPTQTAKRIVVERFDYHNAQGAVVYQSERVEFRNPDGSYVLKDGKHEKTFLLRRPDPDRPGEWISRRGCMAGVPRVPYRFPELLEALAHGRMVVIVEGERKADLLLKWGIPATCNSEGYGSVKQWADHAKYFKAGDQIIVLPDNDKPGRDHAGAVAANLTERGATVRILDLPGLPEKGDVIDWAAAGGTVEKLHALIERDARPCEPATASNRQDKSEAAERKARRQKAKDEAKAADGFTRGDSGQILKGHPENIRRAVEDLGVGLRLNQFSAQTDVAGLCGHGPELNDAGAVRLRLLIHETYGFLPTQELFEQVLVDMAHANRFHPVRDYLDGLKWDGRGRLGIWLPYYLGAEKSEYVESVGRAFFIALVARILNPGCKQDDMLILEGPQGALKSMACEAIAGNWFSDNLPDVRDSKDLSQHLQGKWLIEIGELSALGRAETTTLKAFITRRTERYRPSYGRREVIQPRQCVFVGTTNAECYLKDATGGRRFWPVKVNSIDLDALRADRDQLFAEAVHLFKAGANWWPDRDFEAKYIKPEQDARYVADPWQEKIAAYVENLSRVTIAMIAKDALSIEIPRVSMRDSYRIIDALTSLGWMQKRSHGVGWYIPRSEARLC